MQFFQLSGRLVDVLGQKIFPAQITIANGRIQQILPLDEAAEMQVPYILPGFIDSHVHIESSLLIPSEFARMAVVHGTVATVSDPHEIANVMGVKGVHYMLQNARKVPFKFYFGAPSCVPATFFETAGATMGVADVEALLHLPEIKYLSEMMNFPGVLNKDPEVMAKIAAAQKVGKPVDGHAPGLRGKQAHQYIRAGGAKVVISTDHECFTSEEALDKLHQGMKVIIREGSAAKNFEALIGLLDEYPAQIMFCSDDKHPDSLQEGHINQLVKRALQKGINLFKVLQAACVNPVLHYQLEVGLLREGDPADFIVVNSLEECKVLQTYVNGERVAEEGTTRIAPVQEIVVNHFDCAPIAAADLEYPVPKHNTNPHIRVIEALDGQLITNCLTLEATVHNGVLVSNVEKDILKMVVVNRYQPAPIAIAFVKNFGLQKGAIASSVAHDSHNIIAVGVEEESIVAAVNAVIAARGGLSVAEGQAVQILPLPIAGLMTNVDGYTVSEQYTALDRAAKDLGSRLQSPFMTLSFMALLVIPALKLSDKGLFDGHTFSFTSLVVKT